MPVDIATLIDRQAGDRPSVRVPGRRKVRIVVRLDPPLLARVDALRQRIRPSRPPARAAVLRAFTELGCSLAEELVATRSPLPDGCEPPETST
jgi:hypothetical protein